MRLQALAAACAFLAAAAGTAQEPSRARSASVGRLAISLSGFESDEGDVKVALYSIEAADAFPDGFKRAKRFIKIPIKGKRARLSIADVPYGVYAVSAFHDEDRNGQLNTGLFGIPTEAVGASRNPSGKPDFEDSRFTINSPSHEIKITLSEPF